MTLTDGVAGKNGGTQMKKEKDERKQRTKKGGQIEIDWVIERERDIKSEGGRARNGCKAIATKSSL